jgi:hypothetical protein
MTDDVFQDPEALKELTVHDRDGQLVGNVVEVYVDDWNRRPEWVTVRTGMHGTEETFIPLEDAALGADNALRVACGLDAIGDAPRIDAEQHLGLDREQELYLHYGLTPPAGQSSGAPGVGDERPRIPLSGDEKDIDGVKELAEEPPSGLPRLRRFAATDKDDATTSASGVYGENR